LRLLLDRRETGRDLVSPWPACKDELFSAVQENGASHDLANAASENAAKDATDTLENLWNTPLPRHP
jgi:hypothetical protein